MLRYHERARTRLSENHRDITWPDGRTVTADKRISVYARTCEPPDTSRISRWRCEMTGVEREQFHAIAGDTLERFGYETA